MPRRFPVALASLGAHTPLLTYNGRPAGEGYALDTSTQGSATLALTRELIRRRSVTPTDAGCQNVLIERLRHIGFDVERLPFGEVENFWARRGSATPLFCFAGHTDVVPSGPESDWIAPPFVAHLDGGLLYGRGAADMKGSLAAMVTACERFVARRPRHSGSIAFLITSDEEGDARDGTRRVVDHLERRAEKIDWCLVGEPSSEQTLGDTVKNGRRGSLTGTLRVLGKAGHVAYPRLVDNPIHRCANLLATLAARHWDDGDENFPPTTFQVSNVHAGSGAGNVVPGHVDVMFNFRFSPQTPAAMLRTAVETACRAHAPDYELDWTLFGEPFRTGPGRLVDAVRAAIASVAGIDTRLSTAGGTSDGRFIAPTGAEVVELGPVNATIHKLNEHVAVEDLDRLSAIYERVLDELLS